MRSLLDVNVLLALADVRDMHHRKARAWRVQSMSDGWASCPLTQNGFLRVSSQRKHPSPIPIAISFRVLAQLVSRPDHTFWPDSISLLNNERIDYSRVLGPRQLTDIYLLALAVENGGRLVTLDSSIPIAAVKDATPENLVVIT